MAKRSTPLYEMMITRADTRVPRAKRAREEPTSEEEPRILSGRVLRVPAGYGLVALALVIGLVIGSYMFGAARGARAKEADLQPYLEAGAAGTESGRARDPLLSRPVEVNGAGAAGDPAASRRGAAESGGDRRSPADGAGGGPVESDPRQAGLNYLVLAETQPAGALRLAEFCRDSGLAAYVVPSNNPRFRRVIVLPGFETRSTSDPAVRALLREVRRVGVSWKARYPGESDLSDAYLGPGS